MNKNYGRLRGFRHKKNRHVDVGVARKLKEKIARIEMRGKAFLSLMKRRDHDAFDHDDDIYWKCIPQTAQVQYFNGKGEDRINANECDVTVHVQLHNSVGLPKAVILFSDFQL